MINGSKRGHSLEGEREWTVYKMWRRSLQVRHKMFASSSSGKCAVRDMGEVLPNGRKIFCVQSVGCAMGCNVVGRRDYAWVGRVQAGEGIRWGDRTH
jgi:hypothetical protein